MTEFNATDMRKALVLINRVIERRNTIAVLANVMMKSSGETLTVSGTDLDMEISTTMPCSDDEPLAMTISAKLLTSFIKGCDGRVKITTEGEKTTLENDGMTMAVNAFIPVDDVPVMKFQAGKSATLTESMFRKTIENVASAISTEETRYYLNGIYLHDIDGNLRAVATNGHTLAFYDAGVSWPLAAGIVPRKAVSVLLAAMKKGGNHPVMAQECVGVNRQMMRFIHPDWTLTTKLIDGKYPQYSKVIPAASDKFCCALTHAQISRIPYFGNAVELSPEAGKLTCLSPYGAMVSMPLQGHGDTVGFNLDYLKDFTRIHGTVSLSGAGKGEPHIVKAEDPAFTGVIMPMRV